MKVNFGSGPVYATGWTNIDVLPEFQPDICADIRNGLPLESDSVDLIVAHHSIHMIPFHDVANAMAELLRVLKPDGFLRISIPDIVSAFDAYEEGDEKWFPNYQNHKDIDDTFSAYLTWYSECCTPMTAQTLENMLTKAGFHKVIHTQFGETDYDDDEIVMLDSRKNESLYVEAIK